MKAIRYTYRKPMEWRMIGDDIFEMPSQTHIPCRFHALMPFEADGKAAVEKMAFVFGNFTLPYAGLN